MRLLLIFLVLAFTATSCSLDYDAAPNSPDKSNWKDDDANGINNFPGGEEEEEEETENEDYGRILYDMDANYTEGYSKTYEINQECSDNIRYENGKLSFSTEYMCPPTGIRYELREFDRTGTAFNCKFLVESNTHTMLPEGATIGEVYLGNGNTDYISLYLYRGHKILLNYADTTKSFNIEQYSNRRLDLRLIYDNGILTIIEKDGQGEITIGSVSVDLDNKISSIYYGVGQFSWAADEVKIYIK